SSLLATFNILAFLFHTLLDLTSEKYQFIRQHSSGYKQTAKSTCSSDASAKAVERGIGGYTIPTFANYCCIASKVRTSWMLRPSYIVGINPAIASFRLGRDRTRATVLKNNSVPQNALY
ncbi:hypothetical protein, partial [Nostoc sp.]|uniref:hypothetical protein n=1 Tax=Nostoc sp. TaxID=1180 RepID=UPI003FA5306A